MPNAEFEESYYSQQDGHSKKKKVKLPKKVDDIVLPSFFDGKEKKIRVVKKSLEEVYAYSRAANSSQKVAFVTSSEKGLLDNGIDPEAASHYITTLLDTLRFICRQYGVDTQYKTVVAMAERDARKGRRKQGIFKIFPYGKNSKV